VTKIREGLTELRRFTTEEAGRMIDEIEPLQKTFLKRYGTRFVFLADEWYTSCRRTLPAYETYEDFPQIENGVGLLRLFEGEMLEALEEREPLEEPRRFLMAGGVSRNIFPGSVPCAGVLRRTDRTRAVVNNYFGESVTVGGLVTGGDLTSQLAGADFGRALLIPRAMLKADESVFLDGMTLSEAEHKLHTRIIPVSSGDDLIEIVFEPDEER
jgi:NifB/MoaA-like Fe-S oxidoreductase